MISANPEAHLYIESSAILAFVFSEQRGDEVLQYLNDASLVTTSELTLVECDRALLREFALAKITAARLSQLQSGVHSTARTWDVFGFSPAVIERARQPFPDEPIRSLDAIHVASALHARAAIPDLTMLSLDDRIRRVAGSLGFPLLPA